MATISTQLRSFRDPTKDQLIEHFFSIPSRHLFRNDAERVPHDEPEKMEINAVLSLGVVGEEDSYVCLFSFSVNPCPSFTLGW
jgi:TBC1 domain family member 8/9